VTKKERYEVVRKACDKFRHKRMAIFPNAETDGNMVEFTLPMTYKDGDSVTVFIRPYEDGSGYAYVSDGGRTSFHQMLTHQEIEELSVCFHLSHENFYDEEPPFECNLYDVVKIDKIDEAIMGIIMAIQDSYLYVARHNTKGAIEKEKLRGGEPLSDLQYLCEVFHETAMTVWNVDEESVKMSLPYHFTDGAPAMIEARIMPDGKIRVSDCGLIAAHEPLTPADVYEICDEHGLKYLLKDESDEPPLDCEMYEIVDRNFFCDAVWDIIDAIMAAHDIATEMG
jgi:hypothetical protein